MSFIVRKKMNKNNLKKFKNKQKKFTKINKKLKFCLTFCRAKSVL